MKAWAQKLDNYIYYMLLFTVVVIPLEQEFTALCVFVTFACAVFAAVFGGVRRERVLKTWQQGALFLLLLIAWVSLRFSRDTFISTFNFIYVVGQYAAFGYVLLRYGWQRPVIFGAQDGPKPVTLKEKFFALPRPVQLIGAFLAVSVFVSGLGIAQKFLGVMAEGVWVDPQEFPELKVRVFSTLVNPNILAGYLVLVVAYAAAFFNVFKDNLRRRGVFLAIGLLAAWCLLYTYSRGNWLACAAVLLAFCVLFCRKAFVPVLGGGAVGLAVGGAAVWHRLTSILSGHDTSAALRMAYLKSTQWIIEEYPLGVGWYGYRFVYPTYNYYLADTSVIMYHCHNMFLNVLAELGWHGLVAFLFVWGIFIYSGWQLAWHGRAPWARAIGRGYVLAVIGIAIGGLTDHVCFNTQMGLLFWLLGLVTMLARRQNTFEQ